MLFLITNQSNCFTLFVLKLGGDTIPKPLTEDGKEDVLKITKGIQPLNNPHSDFRF